MADLKISQLTGATTPLAGTEVVPLVQSSTTKKVSVANLTEGRSVGAAKVNIGTSSEFGLLNVSSSGANDAIATLGDFTTPGNSVGIYGRVNGSGVFSIKTAGVAIRLSSDVGLANPVDILNGNIIPGTAAKGINFTANTPAAGMTSQLLNWYEEGTWTPTLVALSTNFNSVTYSSQTGGKYTRIGNRVFLTGTIITSAVTKGAAAGTVSIQGLPFTPAASTGSTQNGFESGAIGESSDWLVNAPTSLRVEPSISALILFYRATSAGNTTAINVTDVDTGSVKNIVRFSICYAT